MAPRSAGSLLDGSPSSIFHRSSTILWPFMPGDPLEEFEREAARASKTSQRFPWSSMITNVWLCVNSFASRKVSIMRGGGRCSLVSQYFHVRRSSRKTSVSSSSTLNCKPLVRKVQQSRLRLRKSWDAAIVTHQILHLGNFGELTHLLTLFTSEPLLRTAGKSTRECSIIRAAFVW